MKKFLLIPNFERNSLSPCLVATDYLMQKGCLVFCQKEDEGKWNVPAIKDVGEVDFILVFGGDGTMIRTVKKFLAYKKPFIGVNTGKVGYLADIDPDKIKGAIDRILEGKYGLEERTTICVCYGDKKYIAVNEGALQRNSAHILCADIEINGQRTETMRADGILVATPTGSTAYNLSAGGPVLMPTARNMVITPVCAHSLCARPIVLGEKDEVTLTVKTGSVPANLTADGEQIDTLQEGNKVSFAVSDQTFTLLRLQEGSFFSVLCKKLSAWEL